MAILYFVLFGFFYHARPSGIGLATIEVCRPMAFTAQDAPKLADLVPGVFGAAEPNMPG